MKQLHTMSIFVLSACTLLGLTLAQTMSGPLDALSSSNWGVGVYLYNPATDSIVSPTGSDNGLTMVPWQYYDNTTMQWTITQVGTVPATFYISAVSPQAAGCDSGTAAYWNAPKKSPVTTLCGAPATSSYTTFLIAAGSADSQFSYVFASYANSFACVAVVNEVPTSPATACNPFGVYAQWQLVTIAP